ncbi:hypothetical protein [uncultured Dokdonia sp.]|uniref:hypothetical protein n=1 Tax=uncultured Dokdonia sp. TaxID=575653 RepID=UPI00262BFD79|nr:hypothetical protein [uncultured Dokdonia sp.]
MKKQIILIAMMCISVISFAQKTTEESPEENAEKLKEAMEMLFGAEVVMDVDKDLYPVAQGTSYFTQDEKAGIIAMVVPASYEKMEGDLAQQESKGGAEILERGTKEIGGKNMLFLKQRIDREGTPYITLIYCMKNTEESSIVVTSFYEESKEKTYIASVNTAVASAKIKAKGKL